MLKVRLARLPEIAANIFNGLFAKLADNISAEPTDCTMNTKIISPVEGTESMSSSPPTMKQVIMSIVSKM
jgi:hypothetical protein